MANASRPSALLSLVHTLTRHGEVAAQVLGLYPPLLPAVLRCFASGITWKPAAGGGDDEAARGMTVVGEGDGEYLGRGPGDRVVLCLLEIVSNLIAPPDAPELERRVVPVHMDRRRHRGRRGGDDEAGAGMDVDMSADTAGVEEANGHGDDDSDVGATTALLLPHTQLLLEQLCIRLGAKAKADTHAQRMRFLRRELDILLPIARFATHPAAATHASDTQRVAVAERMVVLLLPFLMRRARCKADTQTRVLRAVAELVPHVRDPCINIPFLAERLGPGEERIASRDARAALVDVFTSIARVPQGHHMEAAAALLQDMHAYVWWL